MAKILQLGSKERDSRESAGDRFRRLASKRVVRTIRDLRLIGNLGNRSNYSYSSDDVDKIFRTLERELKMARSKFNGSKDEGIDFNL